MAEPRWKGRYTRRRRVIQATFLLVFILLPLLDLFRFDFIRGRLHLFGQEIWLDEWTLIWLALMFLMWLIAATTLVFGRVYCAYACPQMVFSELAHDLDALAARVARRLAPRHRRRAARVLSMGILAVVSVAASVFFMGYFAPLPQVWLRLSQLDFGPWVGAVGAVTALVTFLDFAFVREGFCRTACPYGLLQAVLEDGRSLHVALEESRGECIDCGACERACSMGIDILDGPFQIECTRCGSCVDACDRVLARQDREGVLAFRFGDAAHRRWDVKRVLVAASTVAFGSLLAWAVMSRESISIHVSPVYATAAKAGTASASHAESRYLLRAGNRGREPVTLRVRTEGLPARATVLGLPDEPLPPGHERRFTLVVRLPRSEIESSVTPFVWVFEAADHVRRVSATFFARGGAAS